MQILRHKTYLGFKLLFTQILKEISCQPSPLNYQGNIIYLVFWARKLLLLLLFLFTIRWSFSKLVKTIFAIKFGGAQSHRYSAWTLISFCIIFLVDSSPSRYTYNAAAYCNLICCFATRFCFQPFVDATNITCEWLRSWQSLINHYQK